MPVDVEVAATVKVTGWPAVTVWSAGWVVICGSTGAAFTVNVAAVLVALPEPLRTTARKVVPLSASGRGRRGVPVGGGARDVHAVLLPLIGQRRIARGHDPEAGRQAAELDVVGGLVDDLRGGLHAR